MADNGNEIPQLNVTAKWLDNLFERIAKITNIERICRSGMPSEEKGLQIYEGEQEAQYMARMLDLLIDEVDMLLPYVKRKLKAEDYNGLTLKMNIIKMKCKDPFIKSTQDHVSKEDPEYYTTSNYIFILKNLSLIRGNIIEVLSPLLYGETETANYRRSIR